MFTQRLASITVWGVNPQVNWDGRDAFVGARYPVSLRFNFLPHFLEIHKLLPFAVQEFGIFYTQGQRDTEGEGKGREQDKERETAGESDKNRILN